MTLRDEKMFYWHVAKSTQITVPFLQLTGGATAAPAIILTAHSSAATNIAGTCPSRAGEADGKRPHGTGEVF